MRKKFKIIKVGRSFELSPNIELSDHTFSGILLTELTMIEEKLCLLEKFLEINLKNISIEFLGNKVIFKAAEKRFELCGHHLVTKVYLKEVDHLLVIGTILKVSKAVVKVIDELYVRKGSVLVKIERTKNSLLITLTTRK